MKKRIVFFAAALFLIFSPAAFSATAYDAVASGSIQNNTTLSWSHTVTGANTVLVVNVVANASDSPSAAPTYNGVSTTLVQNNDKATQRMRTYLLINPTTGTNTVSVTYGSTQDAIAGISISITGADQASQPDANNGTNGFNSTFSSTVTPVAADTMLVAFAWSDETGTNVVPASSQTEVADVTQAAFANGRNIRVTGNYRQLVSTGSTANDYTGAFDDYMVNGLTLDPAVAATRRRTILDG